MQRTPLAFGTRAPTRAERGKQELIPARRAHAAFSAASEPKELNWHFNSLDYCLFVCTRERVRACVFPTAFQRPHSASCSPAAQTHGLEFNDGTNATIAGHYVSTGTMPAGSTWAMNPLPCEIARPKRWHAGGLDKG